MTIERHTRRRPTIALVMLAWAVIGSAVPVLVVLYSRGFSLSPGNVIAASSDSFAIAQPILLGHGPTVTLERGALSLVDGAGRVPDGEASAALVASGSAKLVLDGASLLIEGVKETPSSNPLEAIVAPLIEALASQNFDTVALRRSTVKITVSEGHVETFTDVTADIANRRKGIYAVKGVGLLRGQRVAVDATVSGLGDRKATQRLALKMHLKGAELDATFDGRLSVEGRLGLHGQIDALVPSVRQAARWLGAKWPDGPGLRDLRIKGQVDWTDLTLAFHKAAMQMDGNDATGAVSLKFADARPTFDGTLALKLLDLTQYFKGANSESRPWWPWFVSSEIVMPLTQHFDADVRVSAERVTAAGHDLGRSAVTLSLRDGRLLADIAEFEFSGGKGGGQVMTDLSGQRPKVSIRGKLENVDAGRATTTLLGQPLLQGRSTIIADMSASGQTGADLMETLGGKLIVTMRDGGRIGIDFRSLMAATAKSDLEGWTVAARGYTAFDQLESRVALRRGELVTEIVQAMSGDDMLTAVGVLSLPAKRLDIRVVQAAPATARAESALLFTGPLSTPRITLEANSRRRSLAN